MGKHSRKSHKRSRERSHDREHESAKEHRRQISPKRSRMHSHVDEDSQESSNDFSCSTNCRSTSGLEGKLDLLLDLLSESHTDNGDHQEARLINPNPSSSIVSDAILSHADDESNGNPIIGESDEQAEVTIIGRLINLDHEPLLRVWSSLILFFLFYQNYSIIIRRLSTETSPGYCFSHNYYVMTMNHIL